MRSSKKSPANLRTIDLWTKKTQEEELLALQNDLTESPRGSETIEQAAERWRANAFYTQILASKHHESEPSEKTDLGTFRITSAKELPGWWFLERFGNGKDGKAYSWTGVMFRDEDTYELASVVLKLARSKKDKEGGSDENQ